MQDACDRDSYGVARRLPAAGGIAAPRKIVDRVHAVRLARHRAGFERHGLVNMHSLTSPKTFPLRQEPS